MDKHDNGWKQLQINGLKWMEMAEGSGKSLNFWKLTKMFINGWIWLEVIGNGMNGQDG